MKLFSKNFSPKALPKHAIEISGSVNEIGEGAPVNVECGHTLAYGSV